MIGAVVAAWGVGYYIPRFRPALGKQGVLLRHSTKCLAYFNTQPLSAALLY